MKWLAVLLAALSVFAVAKTESPQWEVRDDFATLLADAGAVGTIVVLDEQAKRWYVTNRERAEQPLPPSSTVAVLESLARHEDGATAAPRMEYWLARADYGNRNAGAVRISARDQVLFLKRLADGSLPFSKHAQLAVRDGIVAADATVEGATLRGMPGLPSASDSIGWYVGWLERDGRRWFVAVNFDLTDAALAPKRIELAKQALAKVGALPG